MGESVKSGGRLEVSVSFGRFENDSLSWEKWSSFSPNKYLEEVENISTPGSVAQKKAYFEAHYKKIAARKAEQLEQESPMEPGSFSPDNPMGEDHAENSSSSDSRSGFCNGDDISADEVELETCATILKSVNAFDEARDAADGSTEEIEQETGTTGLTNITTSEVTEEETTVAVKCGSSTVKEDEEEMDGNKINPELNDGEVPILAKKVRLQKDSQDTVEQPPLDMEGRAEKDSVSKKEHSKLNARNQVQKVTPTKKGRNSIGTKKNVVSSTVKSSQVSAPRPSKPTPISTPMSAPRTLKYKVNETPLTKSKSTPLVKIKSAAPTALHMSLSLGPTNSSAAFASTRKSLIMEKMGDKGIVKRAFKTFHNHINGLNPSDEKFSTSKKVSSMASERKVSTSLTPRKENEGPRKASEKTVNPRARAGTRLKSESLGLLKGSGLDSKNAMPVVHSTGMRSDDRAEKRKEFLKKLEAKSIAREAENAQFSTKSKNEKEAEMKKLRQSLNFKATPLPSFYRVQGKGHSEKMSTDSKIHP